MVSNRRELKYNTIRKSLVTCSGGHMTHNFLYCDVRSYCEHTEFVSRCSEDVSLLSKQRRFAGKDLTVEMFQCQDVGEVTAYSLVNVGETIPYSLVCDGQRHCLQNQDEDFCFKPNKTDEGIRLEDFNTFGPPST